MDLRESLRFLAFASLTVSAAGCGEDKPDTVEPAKLTDFQREVLEVHNAARAQARPSPSPTLAPLQWSLHAEQVARDYAEKCTFEHNPDRGHLGENLAAATPGMWTTRQAVQGWADEASDYHYEDNTCAPEQLCGHYTQMVWRATTGVGCAVKTCTRNSPFGPQFPTWQLWVCDYTPPGNVVGEKPY